MIRFNPLTGNMVRDYFWGDQLAYLSISAGDSAGFLRDFEPFTETGRSIYPSGFYAFVGLFSKLTHLQPASALNLVFCVLSVVLVALISQELRKLFNSGVVVFAVLAPLLLGTTNTLTTGNWSVGLDSHAVIWPMSAGLYSANAESLGLLLITLMVAFLVSNRLRPGSNIFNKRLMFSAVFLGLLANSHTYIFFLGMTIAVVLLLDNAIMTSNPRLSIGRVSPVLKISALFLVVLIFLELIEVAPLSRLLVLWVVGFILIGIYSNNRNATLRLIFFLLTTTLVAIPQIVKMGMAYIAHDPFLTSRQQVSSSLSVPADELLLRHLPLSLLVLGAYFVARRTCSHIQGRIVLILYFVWLFLSLNQWWGLSQEPYRFAIDAQVPLAIFSTAIILAGWRTAIDTQIVKYAAFITLAAVVIPSALEFQNFWSTRANAGVIQLDSDQYQEMLDVALKSPPGLLLPDPCIEPGILKVISGKKIAVYSKGLAWPDDVSLIKKLVDARVINILDLNSAKQLKIRALLIDTQCPAQWATQYSTYLKRMTADPNLRFQLYAIR